MATLTRQSNTHAHPLFILTSGLRHYGPPPPWFDRNKLPKLTEQQIAWWDECHIEQQGGKVGDRAYQFTFKRDEDGKLSPTGTYPEATLTKTSFKFPEQARFSFGVASVLPISASAPVGKRIEMFDYTGKNICTREVYKKHMKEECNRVKSLTGKCLPWYVDPRPKDEVWMDDPIKKMKGIGGTKGDTLMAAGIMTVGDIKRKSDKELLTLAPLLKGLSLAGLTELRDHPSHLGACNHVVVDHRSKSNPYQSRYGSFWEEEIKKTSFMKQYSCIRDLVTHIHDHTKEIFKGTVHEDDWFFYHDALKQLTAKSTVAWMKEKGYYSRWLIPQLGLNGGTVYVYRPVGNRPEWMPLDNSLNNDIQSALSLHCAITAHLEDDDIRKFSFSTPSTIVSGIQRIYNDPASSNVPSSKRIVQDCNKALRAFGIVYEHNGGMVPGLANRNGH